MAQQKSFNPWKAARLAAIVTLIVIVLVCCGWSWYAAFNVPLSSGWAGLAFFLLAIQATAVLFVLIYAGVEGWYGDFAKWWSRNEQNYGRIED